MIDPTDFHKTAELLKGEAEEWHVRTVVNRSYYWLFLFCREFLASNGVQLPDRKKKSQHQFVIECFEESKKPASKGGRDSGKNSGSKNKDEIQRRVVGQIWNRLRTLFQNRIYADYRLDLRFPPSYSQDGLRHAQTALQDLESLSGSATEKHIIDTAKIHAQTIALLGEARC